MIDRRAIMLWIGMATGTATAAASISEPAGSIIPQNGNGIADVVPKGYVVEQQQEADFNEDRLPDVALLLVPACEQADVVPGSLEQASCRAEGRLLAIVFRRHEGGYRLSVSNAVSSGVGVHGDHFEGMQVRGRTLSLAGVSFSCAGQEGGGMTYIYRFQDGDCFLIGTEEKRWHRPGGCDRDAVDANPLCPELKLPATQSCEEVRRSTNFNTAVEETTFTVVMAGADDGQGRRLVRRKSIPRSPLRRLATEKIEF
jgi:hypothetical protein